MQRESAFDLLLHRQNFWQVRLLLVYPFMPAKKLVTFFCYSGLVESVGCELQYLPPYSPDLNKIENYWFPIKNRVRKSKGSIEDFRDRVDLAVKSTS